MDVATIPKKMIRNASRAAMAIVMMLMLAKRREPLMDSRSRFGLSHLRTGSNREAAPTSRFTSTLPRNKGVHEEPHHVQPSRRFGDRISEGAATHETRHAGSPRPRYRCAPAHRRDRKRASRTDAGD